MSFSGRNALDYRRRLKRVLARASLGSASGVSILIYHRIGGGSPDELDCPVANFADQVALLARECDVVSLDAALDALAHGDDRPKIVITFDDGFADLHDVAWPILADYDLPFTVYLATGFLGGRMQWEGSTSAAPPAPALTWAQAAALAADERCTIGNHTHTHVTPRHLTAGELDACTVAIQRHLGLVPEHFTYPWGLPVTAMEPDLRARFRSVTTGELGRNLPGADFARLRRIPVRASDPLEFFRAKVAGSLAAERAYAGIVAAAKAGGARG